MSDTAPKRRRFRMSLRGLLVLVAISGCVIAWFGWALSKHQERAATRQWMRDDLQVVELPRSVMEAMWNTGTWRPGAGDKWEQRPLPLSMWIIGEEGIYGVGMPHAATLTPEQQARIEAAFPEAGFVHGLGGY